MALPQRPQRPGRANPEAAPNVSLPQRPVAPQPQPQYREPTPPVYEETYEEEEAVDEDIYDEDDLEPEDELALEDEEDLEPETPVYTPPTPTYEAPASSVTEDEDDGDYEPSREDIEIENTIASFSPGVRDNALALLELIASDDSSEVLLNGPDNIVFKRNGVRYYAQNISFPDVDTYHKVINAVILPNTDTNDRIGKSEFLIEGQLELPDLNDPENMPPLIARVHIIAPPAVREAKVTIAKKAKRQFRLEDLMQSGSMSRQMYDFMKLLARGRATIVFSGLSGSGKTTLLEAMSYEFDENDRVVVVEDTAELQIPLADVVALRSTSHKPGQEATRVVSLEWLVQQANRMRPDRIIVGEVRGSEMAAFLTAANSGADGSMTTVHASSPRQTLDKIASLALNSDSAKSLESINRDIASTVQIVVQTTLIDGQHIIANIEEISNTISQNNRGIQTQSIFRFDRNTNKFIAENQPSDSLKQFLAQRGVSVDASLFSRAVGA